MTDFESKVVTVVIGTYEGGLLVYRVDLDRELHLGAFSSKDSVGLLKSVLFQGKTLYSGGRDEAVRIYNSSRKLQEGALTAQNGSSEGAVTIYGKKDHAFYHTMKLHSKGMLDMDIHPSGRLMLTLGTDFRMKLVDLASMSEVYHKNINPGNLRDNSATEFLRFAPDEENLLLVVRDKIIQFCSEDNSQKEIKKFGSRITSISTDIAKKLIVVGEDSGKLSICKYPSMECVTFQAYDSHRVKDFKFFRDHGLLITISTEGMVSFWDVDSILLALETLEGFDMNLENKLSHLYEFKIDSRLVCLDAKIDLKIAQNEQEVAKIKSITVGKTFIEKLTRNTRKTRVGFSCRRVGAPQIRKLRKQALVLKIQEMKAHSA